MGPLRCPRWGRRASLYIPVDESLDGGCTTLGRAASFSPGPPQRGLTAEGLPAAFPPCRGINPHSGAHHCITTSSFPCLLFMSEVCLFPLLICTGSIFPASGTYLLCPHSHPALATLVHRVNAESQILFVLKFLPPSLLSLTSFLPLSSDRFTCFQCALPA